MKKNTKGARQPRASKNAGASNASKNKVAPLADRVLVRPASADDGETRRPSGIIIPDTVGKERPQEGTVVAVGPGKYDDGVLVPVSVTIGDRVLFSKYGGDEVKVDDAEYIILREDQILAVLN